MIRWLAVTIAGVLCSAGMANAQTGADQRGGRQIAAGTVVEIEITQALTSRTSHPDDVFPIRLATPIVVDGMPAVAAGVTGEGQVIHAAHAGGLGKAGEMIITARYLTCGATRLPLRSFHFGEAGANRVGTALAVSAVVPLGGLLVRGGEVVVPAGTRATAKLADAVALAPDCAASTTP